MNIPRKLGRFQVSLQLIEENWKSLGQFFAQFVIIRAECMYHLGVIEYWAYSELFADLGDGQEIPMYCPKIADNGDGTIAVKV